MPKGAVLVNTARKEVIDEEGLAKLMEERADFHYITDIAPDCDCFSKFEGRFFATPKRWALKQKRLTLTQDWLLLTRS